MQNKIRRIMWGREEHPMTVFVPWDCGHHCPFCTTKAEYETKYPASKLDYFFERQKESVRRMLAYGFVDEVVLTGGEPLADVQRLRTLVDVIKENDRSHCCVYINTSLNLTDAQERAAFRYLDNVSPELIDGISVSLPYADVSMMNARGYEALERLMRVCGDKGYCWIRINSVVRGNESAEQIRKFVKDIRRLEGGKGHGIWSINLRKDYTECDQLNLNDCNDPIMRTLMSMPDMPYKGHGGCLVCRNDVFWPDDDVWHRVTYHRGTERSSLRFDDLLVINDFVIKQDGEIRYDWVDGTALPKRVMDVLAEAENSGEEEWKWKNPDFSHKLSISGAASEMTCRDRGRERCG